MIHVHRPPTGYASDAEIIKQAVSERARMSGSALGVMSGPAGSVWASLKLPPEDWGGAIQAFHELLVEEGFFDPAEDRVIHYWLTALESGGRIGQHDHADAKRTGVYYPHHDTSHAFQLCVRSDITLEFDEGILVEFDPYLPHGVPEWFPNRPTRWSLAWNVYSSNI